MKITVTTQLFLLFSISLVSAQPESPDLELDGYQIVGKDTRVFSITGDRKTTVEFVTSPVLLPGEERDMETSSGLIGEDERLRKTETFSVSHGFYSQLDVMSGSNSPLKLWGKASVDMDGKAGTIGLLNNMAKENTPVNSAPFMQDFEAAGYYDGSFARFSVDMEYGREDDEIGSELFRKRDRSVGRYRGGVTMRLSPFESWDVSGRFVLSGSGFEDSELSVDEDERIITGNARAVSDIGATTVILDASGDYVEMNDLHGTITRVKGMGEWLIGNSIGIKAGASLSLSEAPGDGKTKTRIYPYIAIDWAIKSGIFLKADYKPGVVRHSFTDLYGLNGLVTYDVPMLFEDRKVDANGEFGIRSKSGRLKGSVEAFYSESEDTPVFNGVFPLADTTAVFFDIVQGAKVKISGVKLNAAYDNDSEWGVDGSFTIKNSSWNFSGDVPYIPQVEAAVNGYFMLFRTWRLRSSIRFMGEHNIVRDSGNTEDSFMTIDVGVDRQLWKQYLSLYIDLRNLTNADDAWWTNGYRMPGAGLYAGIKAVY